MFQVIAHRGASAVERENSVAAFRRAVEFGADSIELDVRRTADGVLVVHHDAVVHAADDVGDTQVIAATTAVDLPDRVITLPEALDACEGAAVNVEIKNSPDEPGHDPTDTIADDVAAVLAARPPEDRWLVSSFRRSTAARVTALVPGIASALLTITFDQGEIDRAVAAGMAAIHPWDPVVTPELVAAAHARALAVNVWTVDDPYRMTELADWGVDGICTNVPDVACEVRRRSGPGRPG